MRRQLPPVSIAMAVGLFVLLHQFVANIYLDVIGSELIAWAAIIAAFAVLLGLANVIAVHLQRLMQRGLKAWNSLVILITALGVWLIVLPSGGASAASSWVLRYIYQPLEASFLALLVFFIATAAYRALRARTWETALLVVTALIVLLGTAPLANLLSPRVNEVKEWILNVPAVAGVRGILIGAALGVIATGLRLLTGIDRPYTD